MEKTPKHIRRIIRQLISATMMELDTAHDDRQRKYWGGKIDGLYAALIAAFPFEEEEDATD